MIKKNKLPRRFASDIKRGHRILEKMERKIKQQAKELGLKLLIIDDMNRPRMTEAEVKKLEKWYRKYRFQRKENVK